MIPAGPTLSSNTPQKRTFPSPWGKKWGRNSNLFTIYFLKYFYYLMFEGMDKNMSKKTIESRPYPKLVVINGRDQNQLRGVATPEYYYQS